MRQLITTTILFISMSLCHVNAEEIRDYYSEPGLHPFKNPTSDLNETIDPFSGTLQLQHTDITVPGNGGMDIAVTRFYNNHHDAYGRTPSYKSIYGIGWTMHFGRIVVPSAHKDKICTQAIWSVTTADNPSIEYSNGSRELLVLATDGTGDLITKSNWRAECYGGSGLLVTSPDGTQYTMDESITILVAENQSEKSWYTSEIKDIHNNVIQVSYLQNPNGYKYFDEVIGGKVNELDEFTPDGRLVKFNYNTDVGNGCLFLDNITSNNQTWTYSYSSAYADDDPAYTLCRYDLTEVLLPSGQKWQYSYYPDIYASAGKYSMKKVIYPYGGIFEYTYQHVQFDSTLTTLTTSVLTKNTSGPNITSGTWSYNFAPHSFTITGEAGSVDADVTTVTQPNGTTVYIHQGAEAVGFSNAWTAGLLLQTQVFSPAAVFIGSSTPSWSSRLISNENYVHGADEFDTETYAPLLMGTQTWRNGSAHSTLMSNHDVYGNPQTIEETNIVGAAASRFTNITYYNDPTKWIIGKKEDETIVGIGTIDRAYNTLGQLTSENKYGVTTSYTYTPEGDLETVTDARLNTMTYSDYYRGIARTETHPESVTITRTVNDTGTVASQTNGRLFTKNFTYDSMNRLDSIDLPINADVSVVSTATGKILTRGNYEETVTFDGFGTAVQVDRKDLLTLENITKTTTFDALGQKIFESYPNSVQGISFTYDVLGRLTRLEHPDGAFRSYTFDIGGIFVTETDERNNQTEYLYRAYGHPDTDKVPVNIFSPENICTYISYNQINQMTQVFQGDFDVEQQLCFGSSQDFTYDINYFLETETKPETGVTTYGRDAVGNMVSRQVGTSGIITYTYDNRNRLTFTDYSGTTPDVTRVYDNNDNIRRADNADSLHEYIYDNNDNLTSEVIDIGTNQYTASYAYDNLDILNTLTYPSGRVVDYSADAFGRPTQALPYVTNLNYYPSGQIQQMVYANGQITDITLTNRLWVDRIHAHGSTELTDLTYQYDDIGNINSITDAVDTLNNRVMGYDGMNRLTSASGSWGAGSFSYDGKGNITTMNIGSSVKNYNYSSQRLNTLTHTNSNTENLYTYDDYGNIEFDTLFDSAFQVLFQNQYIYDDANNLRTAKRSIGSGVPVHNFGYDSNNMRVSKTTPSESLKFVYIANGNLLGEYVPANDVFYGKEYIYLGSQLIANTQQNQLPVADAGFDDTVTGAQTVTLDGSNSSDLDGTIASYFWQQTVGTSVTLTDPLSATTTFISPTLPVDKVLTFSLTVTDNDGDTSISDIVNISVLDPNRDLDGDDLSDAWEIINFGDIVTYSGADDPDGDGVTNLQEFQEGTDPIVAAPPSSVPDFTATSNDRLISLSWGNAAGALIYDVYWGTSSGVTTSTGTKIMNVSSPYEHTGLTNGSTYYYIIVANNNSGVSPVSAELSASPQLPPVVNHGGPYVALANEGILFDGRGSTDPNGQPLKYHWDFGDDTDNGYFSTLAWEWMSYPALGDYTVTLTVTNGTSSTTVTTIASIVDVYPPGDIEELLTFASPGAVTVSWPQEKHADSYQLYWGLTPAEVTAKTNMEIVADNWYQHAGLTDGQRYYYSVEAVNENGVGKTSSVADAMPGDLSWTTTHKLFSGFPSDAKVVMDSSGRIHVLFINSGNLYVRFFSPTSGWSEDRHLSSLVADLQAIASPSGHAIASWRYGGDNLYGAYFDPKRNFWSERKPLESANGDYYTDTEVLPDSMDIAISDTGYGVVSFLQVGARFGTTGTGKASDIVYINRYVPGLGFRGRTVGDYYNENVDDYIGYSANARVAINDAGTVAVAWDKRGYTTTNSSNTRAARVNIMEYQGPTIGPVIVSTDPDGYITNRFPDVAINKSGQVSVVWFYDEGRKSNLWARDYDPAIGWNTSPSKVASSNIPATSKYKLKDNGHGILLIEYTNDSKYTTLEFPSTWSRVKSAPFAETTQDTLLVSDGLIAREAVNGQDTFYSYDEVSGWQSLTSSSQKSLDFAGTSSGHITVLSNEISSYVSKDVDRATPPVILASVNASVNESTSMILNGSASYDLDRDITKYTWRQVSGPVVTISNANSTIATATVGTVGQDESAVIEFEITDGATNVSTQQFSITVIDVTPGGGGGDTVAPITSITSTRSTSKGKVYFDITLSPNETATTYFRVLGGSHVLSGGTDTIAWQLYSGAINIKNDKNQSGTLEYYSTDTAGNVEVTQTEILQ